MTARKMTITDVAREAGVSKGTVSRVINGREGVGENTRERVLKMIDELGFEASYFAQNLAGRRSHTVGVVFPVAPSGVFSNPIYPELLGAIGDELAAAGYSLSVITVTSNEDSEHVLRDMTRGRVDGVLLPAVREGESLLDRLLDASVPTVLIGHRIADDRATWVDCDSEGAVEEIGVHLIEQGHDRLALINGPRELLACRLRERGFLRAVEAREPARGKSIYGDFSAEHGYQTAKRLLTARSRKSRPSALLAGSDVIAGGCLGAARELGLEIGSDVVVTGFDDDRLAPLMHPPLTTVRMPLLEMGRSAAQRLISIIDGHLPEPPLVLPTTVVWRESASK